MKKNLAKLFIEELKSMLDAEEQIIKGLPKLIKAAESNDLKKALHHHLKETRGQVSRIKHVFRMLGLKPQRSSCKAIKGLIQECAGVIKDYPKSAFRDAAIIAKAQRIEHFEMSAYGTLCAFAKELQLNKKVPSLLHKTFDEEQNADKTLTKLAKGNAFKPGINHEANEWKARYPIAIGW